MIVTLLTDFGNSDYFVAAMKGVLLSRNPAVRIVDISHDIAPYDLRSAAFLLLSVHQSFPAGTVHVVVVDPGVGSQRSPIVVQAAGYYFAGPDNGVFDMILDRTDGAADVRRIENPELIAPAAGNTFHGRDIFAPTAAALAGGFPFEAVGRPVETIVRPRWLETPVDHTGRAEGSILHIDRFGNCVTSFRPDRMKDAGLRLRIRDRLVEELRSYYADGAGSEPFMIVGSAGFVEIAVDRGSAAAALRVQVGDRVIAETIEAR